MDIMTSVDSIQPWIETVASAATAVLAGYLLIEAKHLVHERTVQAHNDRWNDMNHILLTENNHECLTQFMTATDSPQIFDRSNRVNWILYIWLNIIESYLLDLRKEQVPFDRGCKVIFDEFKMLHPRKAYLSQLMSSSGYSENLTGLFERFDPAQSFTDYRHELKLYVEMNSDEWYLSPQGRPTGRIRRLLRIRM